ncbi:protein of unknown function DUF1028 [halophilic archaeon DL31]|jgi:uncharacterized Ntn-hydrolase superfamily protein|nr:protein of unknown function DUF1028 [halophilic archaeon DL31]
MTFSICTHVTPEEHDAGDGPAFAVAVATKAPAVGALCPYVSHEGAVSTQAFVNVRLGRRGIALLDDLAVDDALPGLLEQDEHSELRQLHGVDYRGNTFAFTGDECDEWCGHEVRDGITAAGNCSKVRRRRPPSSTPSRTPRAESANACSTRSPLASKSAATNVVTPPQRY